VSPAEPGSSYATLVTKRSQSKGSQTTSGHKLGGLSNAVLCPPDSLAVTADRSGNPTPIHSVNIPRVIQPGIAPDLWHEIPSTWEKKKTNQDDLSKQEGTRCKGNAGDLGFVRSSTQPW